MGSELLAFGDLLGLLSQLSIACASLGCLYLLAFAVFIASFFGSAVRWRGFRGRVQPDGTLLPDERRATP
jgi:hypothetical protein